MKTTPKHNPVKGPRGESYKNRVKKSRTKANEARKTKKRQRKLKKR